MTLENKIRAQLELTDHSLTWGLCPLLPALVPVIGVPGTQWLARLHRHAALHLAKQKVGKFFRNFNEDVRRGWESQAGSEGAMRFYTFLMIWGLLKHGRSLLIGHPVLPVLALTVVCRSSPSVTMLRSLFALFFKDRLGGSWNQIHFQCTAVRACSFGGKHPRVPPRKRKLWFRVLCDTVVTNPIALRSHVKPRHCGSLTGSSPMGDVLTALGLPHL